MPDDSNVVGLREFRDQRDEDPNRVPCANCGKRIALMATRCEHCGITFQGSALEFAKLDEPDASQQVFRRRLFAALAIVVAVTFLLAIALGR